jgi:hypothetical protein
MVAGCKPAAGRANATGRAATQAILAKQGLGQNLGQMQLANTGAAMKQQGMRQPPAHICEPVPHVMMPRIIVY